jgi:hypothetical protein
MNATSATILSVFIMSLVALGGCDSEEVGPKSDVYFSLNMIDLPDIAVTCLKTMYQPL